MDPFVYSEKYFDATFEYRHVVLPREMARFLPRNRLLSEREWRSIGVRQSPGWIHYDIHRPEPHILLFRRPLNYQQEQLQQLQQQQQQQLQQQQQQQQQQQHQKEEDVQEQEEEQVQEQEEEEEQQQAGEEVDEEEQEHNLRRKRRRGEEQSASEGAEDQK